MWSQLSLWQSLTLSMTMAVALANAQDITRGRVGGDGEPEHLPTRAVHTCPSQLLDSDSTSFMQTLVSKINRRSDEEPEQPKGGFAPEQTSLPLTSPRTPPSTAPLVEQAALPAPEGQPKGLAMEKVLEGTGAQESTDAKDEGAKDEGSPDHLLSDMMTAMQEADADEVAMEKSTGCPDGLKDTNGLCVEGNYLPGDDDSSLFQKEGSDQIKAGSNQTPVSLFVLDPFDVPPIKKRKFFYTWEQHVNLPIHHRIEFERQCNGTVSFMCGKRLEDLHEHVELMDQNYVTLDVHETMQDPIKNRLTESHFPLTLIFMDRKDIVRENGEMDWAGLFDDQIKKANEELVNVTAALDKAKEEAAKQGKGRFSFFDTGDYKIERQMIKVLEQRFGAQCDAEEKRHEQLWDIKERMLKQNANTDELDGLRDVGKASLKRDLKTAKRKEEELIQKLKAKSFDGDINKYEDLLDQAKANVKWLPELKDMLVEEMEETNLWSTVKSIFSPNGADKKGDKLTAETSKDEGLKMIKDKGTVKFYLEQKVKGKIKYLLDFGQDYGKEWGENKESWTTEEERAETEEGETTNGEANEQSMQMGGVYGWNNPTAHIMKLLIQVKLLLLGAIIPTIGHIPVVGPFLSYAVTILVEMVFAYLNKVVARIVKKIMGIVVDQLTEAIVAPVVQMWDTAFTSDQTQTDFGTALGLLVDGAKDESKKGRQKVSEELASRGKGLEEGLKKAQPDIKGKGLQGMKQAAENIAEERDAVSDFNDFFKTHSGEDQRCTKEVIRTDKSTNKKYHAKCGQISNIKTPADCYKYCSKLDEPNKRKDGMCWMCTPTGRLGAGGCTHRQGSNCLLKAALPKGCPSKVIVAGAEPGREAYMGVYAKESYTKGVHGHRELYKKSGGKVLYYWAAKKAWIIGGEGDENQGHGYLNAQGDVRCPDQTKGWKQLSLDRKWTASNAVSVTEFDVSPLPSRDPAVFGCFAVVGGGNSNGGDCDSCERKEDYGSTYPECMCLGKDTGNFEFKLYAKGSPVSSRYFNLETVRSQLKMNQGDPLECKGILTDQVNGATDDHKAWRSSKLRKLGIKQEKEEEPGK